MIKRILVLCTGNSCRSIMAEALINYLGQGLVQAYSAGSQPSGYVHPQSIKTLERHGIDVGEPTSKSWQQFAGQHFDMVITVCDRAAAESCPVFAGKYQKLHWSIPDPTAFNPTITSKQAAFDQVYELLKFHVEKEIL